MHDDDMDEGELEFYEGLDDEQKEKGAEAKDKIIKVLKKSLKVDPSFVKVKAKGLHLNLQFKGGRLFLQYGDEEYQPTFTKLKEELSEDTKAHIGWSTTASLGDVEGRAFCYLMDYCVRPITADLQFEEKNMEALKAEGKMSKKDKKGKPVELVPGELLRRKTFQPTYKEDVFEGKNKIHSKDENDYSSPRMLKAKCWEGQKKSDRDKRPAAAQDDGDKPKGKAAKKVIEDEPELTMFTQFRFMDPEHPEFEKGDEGRAKGIEAIKKAPWKGIVVYWISSVFHSGKSDEDPDIKMKIFEIIVTEILPPSGAQSQFAEDEISRLRANLQKARKGKAINSGASAAAARVAADDADASDDEVPTPKKKTGGKKVKQPVVDEDADADADGDGDANGDTAGGDDGDASPTVTPKKKGKKNREGGKKK